MRAASTASNWAIWLACSEVAEFRSRTASPDSSAAAGLPLTTSASSICQPASIFSKPARFRFSAFRRRSSRAWALSTSAWRASIEASSCSNWAWVARTIWVYSTGVLL